MVVGICDDNEYSVECIKDIISNMKKTFDGQIEICEYCDGKDIFKDNDINKLDLLFLDIDMPYIDGIKVGDYIRNKLYNYDMEIVYVTGMSGYEKKLFDYQPLYFLEKPIKAEAVEYCINKCNDLKHLHDRIFQCVSNRKTFDIRLGDIVYFETNGRCVNLFRKGMDGIPINKTIAQIMEELPLSTFIQINRCQIVNVKYIQTMMKYSLEMVDGKIFDISRDRSHEVTMKFVNIMRMLTS